QAIERKTEECVSPDIAERRAEVLERLCKIQRHSELRKQTEVVVDQSSVVKSARLRLRPRTERVVNPETGRRICNCPTDKVLSAEITNGNCSVRCIGIAIEGTKG